MVAAILLGCLGIFLMVAMLDYSPDQISGAGPVSSNVTGPVGAWIADRAIVTWGLAAFYLPVLLLAAGLLVLRSGPLENLSRRLTGAALLLPALAGLMHLLPTGSGARHLLQHWDLLRFDGLGGSVGFYLCGPQAPPQAPAFPGGLLRRYLDVGGSALVLGAIAAGSVWLMQVGLAGYLRRAWIAFSTYQPGTRHVPRSTATFSPPSAPPLSKARTTTAFKEVARRMNDADQLVPADDLVERIRERRRALDRQGSESGDAPLPVSSPVAPAAAPPAVNPPRRTSLPPQEVVTPFGVPTGTAPDIATVAAALANPTAGRPDSEPVEEPDVVPTVTSATPAPPKPRKPKRAESVDGAYELPPVDLLEDVPKRKHTEHENEKQTTARTIEEVFANFAISVKVVAASRGPVITMYEIQLQDAAMRVQKVEGFEKDMSLKLGTEGIRIVAPLPNKKTIGIEVPNRVKEAVVMRDLVEQIDATQMTLPLILGRDVIGAPMMGDLAKMPHLLVAGATGTGKSVCMNAMICSILLFRGPDEVKFIMVDPKMVELAGYEDIPHLLTPPITDMKLAHAALEWVCRTMDERYFALRMVGVRDIKAYNELGEAEIRSRLSRKNKSLDDLPGIDVRMPYIVVVVDEYADLMMSNKEVEKSIIRLTQKSRAAGIHVILTTQRPSADVVTGLIKSNLPARICFRVADKSNSRVVLDAGGAENLLGKGDLLYLPPGSNGLVRGQGVWVRDGEIEAIIAHAKSQGEPQYDESIISAGAVAMVGGGQSGDAKTSEWLSDRQFHEAVQSMYRYNRSGADFFRRKLNIGYNKATAYVEQLEDLAFLGPQKGTAAREIIKSWDDWIELLKANGHTWDEDDELYHNPVEIRS
ncbi:MAG: DNA translocase FtsK 4TM domain-containing protein [Planctomycetes bacterium]|nr:DNA translocase FtsK 4TM domain-containing protein [Planctomycetota bacterium]